MRPCVLLGSEDKKMVLHLNSVSNYLGDGWNETYKYCANNEVKDSPKIFINSDYATFKTFIYPEDKLYINKDNLLIAAKKFLETDAEYFLYIENKFRVTNQTLLTHLFPLHDNIELLIYPNKTNYFSNL